MSDNDKVDLKARQIIEQEIFETRKSMSAVGRYSVLSMVMMVTFMMAFLFNGGYITLLLGTLTCISLIIGIINFEKSSRYIESIIRFERDMQNSYDALREAYRYEISGGSNANQKKARNKEA